jgi:hypothetical protein
MGNGVTEYLNWTQPLQKVAVTFFAHFIENGTLASAGRVLFSASNAAGSNPRLYVGESGGKYAFVHHNGSAGVSSTMTGTAPVNGDLVELRCHLYADGGVQIWQSINGAAETTPGKSATQTINAWASPTILQLNAVGGGNIGVTDWLGFVLAGGLQTQTKLREALV